MASNSSLYVHYTTHPNSPESINSFATAKSSLLSDDLESSLNFKVLGLGSESSKSFGSEIEPDFYEHETKKEIYRKRRGNRLDEEDRPRRK